MRVVVLSEFRDKYNFSHIFKVGETLEFTDERSEDLLARGLVKRAEEKSEVEVTEMQSQPEEPDPNNEAKMASEVKAEEAIAKARKAVRNSKK